MAQYHVPEADELFQCPYDDTHMVRAKRWPYHLMKCRKNHIGGDLAVCPFNARHEVFGGDFRYHVAHCPDKALVEQYMHSNREDDNIAEGSRRVKLCDWNPPPSEEDWNNDIPTGPRRKVDPLIRSNRTVRNINEEQRQRIEKIAKENVNRLRQGLPVLEAKEKLVLESDTSNKFRLPWKQPKALQTSHPRSREKKGKTPSSVFEYSVALSGVGRGRGVLQMFQGKEPQVGSGSRTGSSEGSCTSYELSRVESQDGLEQMINCSTQSQPADTMSVTNTSVCTSMQEIEDRLADVFPSDVSVYRRKHNFAAPGFDPILVSAGVGRGRKCTVAKQSEQPV